MSMFHGYVFVNSGYTETGTRLMSLYNVYFPCGEKENMSSVFFFGVIYDK